MSAENTNQGMLDAALEISARRAKTLREVKALLSNNQDREAVKLMRKFLGMDEAKPTRLALVKGRQ